MKRRQGWVLGAVFAALILLASCKANTALPESGDHSGSTGSSDTTRVSGEDSGSPTVGTSTTVGTGAIDGDDLFGEDNTATTRANNPSSASATGSTTRSGSQTTASVSGGQTTKTPTTTTKAATTKLVAQDKDGDGWLDGWYYPGR